MTGRSPFVYMPPMANAMRGSHSMLSSQNKFCSQVQQRSRYSRIIILLSNTPDVFDTHIMPSEETPLLYPHPHPNVTLVTKTNVSTIPFSQPFYLPSDAIAVITTPQSPPSSLLQQLNLPQLPRSGYPRLQTFPEGLTLRMPTLSASANATTVLAVTPTALSLPPSATVDSILAVLAINTIPTFIRAVEAVGNALDNVEATSLTQKHSTEVEQIWRVRREVTRLRRHGVALRHVLRSLSVQESTIRNLQIGLDTLSLIRDSAHGALELLLALQNNRMQETMQTLAVVTTIFVPLTFLAGIEGMNFVNQPELSWGWSYGAFWAVVAVLVVGQIVFFRRKGWI